MKNYLKLFVPTMLLLVTTSAFAQEINIDEEYTKFEETKGKVIASVKYICKGNPYCEDYAVLLAKTSPTMKEVNAKLTAERDYKQALYNIKYAMAQNSKKGMYVDFLETDQISTLSTFAEAKNYLTDMPLTERGYEDAVITLDKLAKSTEEWDTIKQMVKEIYQYREEDLSRVSLSRRDYDAHMFHAIEVGKINQCPETLNVKEYGQVGKMCYILNKFAPTPAESKKIYDIQERSEKITAIKQQLMEPSVKIVKTPVPQPGEYMLKELKLTREQKEKAKEQILKNPRLSQSEKESLMKNLED